MASISWILIAISVVLNGVVTGSLLKTKLIRTKRWKGNAGMNGDMSNMFRGTAGVDYPDLKSIPTTNFKCSEQQFEGGLYADVEAQCQVYHVCHDGRKDSFLCGKGTIFNQQILACDYWYSTECETAPSFYYLNSQIGDSSWVAPQGNSQYNPNNQESGYQPNYQDGRPLGGLTSGAGQQGNGEKPCCCLKNNYQAPWSFPSH
ncbi:chitin-binding type-2 domain-containing protein [Caerostris extrusa]|uniref:Chitin-binding type-2 domain-containing protein n=1 Tax=Caerostris extrusa TaxID=172846 RepID=A0AAV4PAZ7_CAEEX|nr:chitin-binding type-2 domain-containing protein [Caerostris extrusa]